MHQKTAMNKEVLGAGRFFLNRLPAQKLKPKAKNAFKSEQSARMLLRALNYHRFKIQF